MAQRISSKMKSKMQNPFYQFFRFIILNIKILRVVALGHGGTREEKKTLIINKRSAGYFLFLLLVILRQWHSKELHLHQK